ncbi:hypothetical protein KC887_00285 [Candidatus Kaiserbacteria bacterium]|nr:hypothetical protein [Candidatus Kaiserbacteria bacterium]
MSESSLSVDYATLVRHAARKLAVGRVFSNGTVTITGGTTVTLTGGSFPQWAGQSAIQIEDSIYQVSSRDSDTILTISGATNVTGKKFVMLESSDDDSTSQLIDIQDMINEALRIFYAPQIVEVPKTKTYDSGESVSQITVSRVPHTFSFLRVEGTISGLEGDAQYPLPDDCGQVTSDWSIFVSGSKYPLAIVSPGHLSAISRQGQGMPRYVCVRGLEFDPEVGQRFEVVLDIKPDQDITLVYRYNVVPQKLNPTNSYPYGGGLHGQTILSAVLSQCERYLECESRDAQAEFERRLISSLQLDLEAKEYQSLTFATEKPLFGSYDWLRQEIAMAIGENPNYNAWDYNLAQRIDSFLQRGLKIFYQAQLTGIVSHMAHKWSFLRPQVMLKLNAPYTTGTVEVVDGLVTLTGGHWPGWVIDCDLIVGNKRSRVKSILSDTKLLLEDIAFNADDESLYSLVHCYSDVCEGFSGLDSPLVVVANDTIGGQRCSQISQVQLLRLKNYLETNSEFPAYCSLITRSREDRSTKSQLEFWPNQSSDCVLVGTVRIEPGILRPGEFIIGNPSHYATALQACISVAIPKAFQIFQTLLASSIEHDQSEHTPVTLGLNLDKGQLNYHDSVLRRRAVLTHDGEIR